MDEKSSLDVFIFDTFSIEFMLFGVLRNEQILIAKSKNSPIQLLTAYPENIAIKKCGKLNRYFSFYPSKYSYNWAVWNNNEKHNHKDSLYIHSLRFTWIGINNQKIRKYVYDLLGDFSESIQNAFTFQSKEALYEVISELTLACEGYSRN